MMSPLLFILEYNTPLLPVDGGIVLVQPWHAQYDIIASEGDGDESQLISVGADENRDRGHDTACSLLTTISECDEIDARQRRRTETMLVDERSINEIASGTAVKKEDSAVTSDSSNQLKEAAIGDGELIETETRILNVRINVLNEGEKGVIGMNVVMRM